MGKPNKSLRIGGIVISVLIVLGFVVAMNFTSVVKKTAEKVASNALGVSVSIGGLDIKIKERKIAVSDIKVGNPSGFKKPYAMTFDLVSIDADKISKELLTFDDITVGPSDINFELNEKGTNLGALKANAAKNKPAAKEKVAKEPGKAPKVIINKLTLEKTSLNPTVTMAGGDLTAVSLPPIKLSGIGQKEGGVLATEAIAQILDHVTQVASKAAAKQGFMEGAGQDILKNAGVPTNMMEQLKSDSGDLGGEIKGLFGK